MKKNLITIVLVALSVLFASCQRDDFKINGPTEDLSKTLNSFTTPASAAADTRMTYEYTTNAEGWGVNKTFEKGDQLIGFVYDDSQYKYFTFECTDISGTPAVATWTRVADKSDAETPKKGYEHSIYLAFAPGHNANGFSGDGEIYINGSLLHQNDTLLKTIACGTGTLDNNDVMNVNFTNQMAMLCIGGTSSSFTEATTIKGIQISGVKTKATLGLEGEEIVLTPTENSDGTIWIEGGDDWTINAEGVFSKTLFVPILPGASTNDMEIVLLTDNGDYKGQNLASNKTIEAQPYRYLNKTYNRLPVASVNGEDKYTFDAALDAANAASNETSATILLSRDCRVRAAQAVVNNSNTQVTLDLAGHTLFGSIKFATDFKVKDDTNKGKVIFKEKTIIASTEAAAKCCFTLDGGTIEATYDNAVSIEGSDASGDAEKRPTARINKGKIICEDRYALRVKYSNSADSVVIGGVGNEDVEISANRCPIFVSTSGYIKINKGTFTSTGNTEHSALINLGAASGGIIVNDGIFNSEKAFFYYYNDDLKNFPVYIDGGKFKWVENPIAKDGHNKFLIRGGEFTKSVTPAAGYKCSETSDPVYKYKVEPLAVAKIGDVTYTSFSDAVSVANNSETDVTIQMISDIALSEPVFMNNTKSKKITLDLNGCTISGSISGTSSSSAEGAMIQAQSDFVVTDSDENKKGTIINNQANAYARAFAASGDNLTINGGIFSSKGQSGAVFCTATNVIINGGTFKSERTGGGCPFYVYKAASTITINGGTFIDVNGGTSTAFRAGGATLDITGGYFHSNNSTGDIISSTGVAVIHGGYFSKEPASGQIPSGYKVETCSETSGGLTYGYRVIEDSSVKNVASIGETKYKNILVAVVSANASQTDTTIKILENITSLESGMKFTNSSHKITLDLNEKKITGKADSLITAAADLIIKNGTIESSKGRIIVVSSNAKVEVNDMTLYCTRGGYAGAGSEYSVIAIEGKNDDVPEISVNNSLIYSKSFIKCARVQKAKFTLDNSQLICNQDQVIAQGKKASRNYYCMYATTGSVVTIKNGSIINSRGVSEDGCAAIFMYGDATVDLSTSYVYTGGSNPTIGRTTEGTPTATYKISGSPCYFSATPNTDYAASGSHSVDELTPPVQKTDSKGNELSFGYGSTN